MDCNNDGILDIILGGNQYEFKPQYGRLDSSLGSVLLGNKNGNYTWVSNKNSGFLINGEVKAIKIIKTKTNSSTIIAVVNNNKPKIFKRND